VFIGSHSGYRRLEGTVVPIRAIALNHASHELTVADHIEGLGRHTVTIPLHLASGVKASLASPNRIRLTARGRDFLLSWSPADQWAVDIGDARISPSYGVVVPSVRIVWKREGALPASLVIRLSRV
jgi:hypothetical protein